MILYLTSSPTGPLDRSYTVSGIDPKNGLLSNLQADWPSAPSVLMISAFPDDTAANTEMRQFFANALEISNLPYSRFDLWDRSFPVLSRDQLAEYGVILLGGGHVPTQHAFFEEIRLREKLRDLPCLVLGISAGSMNCAEVVYAQPELPGEAADPNYIRFFPGLALTRTMILPHYQMVKDTILDGLHLFNDIARTDSNGRRFVILPDGSYIIRKDGKETVFGEAYEYENGNFRLLCQNGESQAL